MLDFGHDTALESIITAMGLFNTSFNGNVTLDEIDNSRPWQSASISPMGGKAPPHPRDIRQTNGPTGKLFVERQTCASGGRTNGTFVRMLLNEAVVPLNTLPACKKSWGASKGLCRLSSFLDSQSFALGGADFASCAKSKRFNLDL